LGQAFTELMATSKGVECIGLVYGYSGLGKTTATSWLSLNNKGIFLRATPLWTPNVMLQRVMVELGKEPKNRNQDMLDEIATSLALHRRPIFVDECDMLFQTNNPGRMLETLRSVYDVAHCPIILVGMELVKQKIARWPQLNRRITQVVEFQQLGFGDARALADACCEVAVADDLLADLCQEANGNCGYLTNGLTKIEFYGKRMGGEIDLAAWKDLKTAYFLDRR
jgi:hypothetical protein